MFSFLLLVVAGTLLGSICGALLPGYMEAGATRFRGALVGFRNGALYGTAAISAVAIWISFALGGKPWPAICLVAVMAMIGGLTSRTGPGWAAIRSAVWTLACLSLWAFCELLGWGNAITAIILGWVGGFVAGGVLMGGVFVDFLSGLSPRAGGSHVTSHSARYGAASALIVMGCLAPIFQSMQTPIFVLVTLCSGFGAGLLTASGKYSKKDA